MKNTRQLAVIAALGMLAFATSSAKAVLLDVTIKGSVTTQAATTTNGTKVTFKETKTTVSSTDVVKTLETIKGTTYADGDKIVYDSAATTTNIFTIRDKDNAVKADVTENIDIESGAGETITGSANTNSTDESTTASFFGTIAFAPGNANEFILGGLVTDKLSVKGTKTSETVTLKSGAGPARVNGAFGHATGSITFKSQKQ